LDPTRFVRVDSSITLVFASSYCIASAPLGGYPKFAIYGIVLVCYCIRTYAIYGKIADSYSVFTLFFDSASLSLPSIGLLNFPYLSSKVSVFLILLIVSRSEKLFRAALYKNGCIAILAIPF
jgi:hypothetical protein